MSIRASNMENPILISWLNDFVFCPASIYFHQLYGEQDRMLFQCTDQINGTNAHASIDAGKYSTRKNVLQAVPIFCEEYGIVGKIDVFDIDKEELTERKKRIKTIYDGYVFQLYAQCLGLRELGYTVSSIRFYALDTNKVFPINLPEDDATMFDKFTKTIHDINSFSLNGFRQKDIEKCRHCIYEPACDRSLL
jgi:CRISPR-associated protein Cas4